MVLPSSPFTFYPNGTVKLVDTQSSIYMKWSFAIIPLQAPTSFQANSTYVLYSARGPAQCVVSVAFKQVGNTALFSMFGTAANPCASSTFSIKLNAFGSILQTFNSTGGTSGTICRVLLDSIDWNWCTATLTATTVSYSAGTIQIKNSATTWSFVDPIAVDGGKNCSIGSGASTCSTASVTVGANELIIITTVVNTAGAGGRHATTPTATGLTFSFRTSEVRTTVLNISEWWTIVGGSGFTGVLTCNESANGLAGCNGIDISGEDTTTTFDTNAAIPALAQGGNNNKPTVSTVSTNNANDLLLGLTGTQGTTAQTAGTCAASTCTIILAGTNGPVDASEYLVVSATQSSATVAFGTNTGANNGWVIIADAVRQAPSNVNYVFTLSETISASPSIQEIGVKKPSATVSITPTIQKIGKELLAATVSITPSVKEIGMKAISATVSATLSIQKVGKELVNAAVNVLPAVQEIGVKALSATVSITPSITCTFNAGACGLVNYVFTLTLNVAVKPALACIANGFNCAGAGAGTVVGSDNIMWVLLIPLVMVIFLALLAKRRR